MNMTYISVAEASEKWGVSLRQVQRLLALGRIPYAKKYGRSWMIPEDADKPIVPRLKSGPSQQFLSDLAYVLAFTYEPAPRGNPDGILDTINDERVRLMYEGALAYLRGDFARTINCYKQNEADDSAKLCSSSLAIAAAISLGDYRFYTEVETYLKSIVEAGMGADVTAYAELALATAHVSAMAPNMAPGWLKDGDFSALPPQAKPDAAYKRAKFFQCLGDCESMLAVAQTALAFCASENVISSEDVYLRLMCAVACYQLERTDEAKKYLLDTMDICLPHGFITPFSELITVFGGLMEPCLKQAFPGHYDSKIGRAHV